MREERHSGSPGAHHPVLRLAPYSGQSDFTRFLPARGQDKAEIANGEEIRKALGEDFSFSDSVTLNYDDERREEVRSLICPCFDQRWYSLTFRRLEGCDKAGSRYEFRSDNGETSCGYDPLAADEEISEEDRKSYLFGWRQYTEVLFGAIFPKNAAVKRTGLVAVAGSTSAGKSNIARGIIHSYLNRAINDRKSSSRRPHLLTFEDPIEKLYYEDPLAAQRQGLDYTPRQKGKDVANLSDALKDALRQTPEVMYVGETRNTEEWKDLLRFAATGHLIFTTCHAGSLTEVISSIRDSMEAYTTAKRAALASRLLAVIHVRAEKVRSAGGKESKNALLPALWSRTPEGINALTSDGLAAILPHSIESHETLSHYCYGRYYFSKQLMKLEETPENQPYQGDIYAKAVGLDLDGL